MGKLFWSEQMPLDAALLKKAAEMYSKINRVTPEPLRTLEINLRILLVADGADVDMADRCIRRLLYGR